VKFQKKKIFRKKVNKEKKEEKEETNFNHEKFEIENQEEKSKENLIINDIKPEHDNIMALKEIDKEIKNKNDSNFNQN